MSKRVPTNSKQFQRFLFLLHLKQEYIFLFMLIRVIHKTCKEESRGRLHSKDVYESEHVSTGIISQRNMFPLK